MKYDHLPAFEKHLKNSAPNLFVNVYLILGKNGFECKEATDLLIRSLIPDEKQHPFSLSLFDSSSSSIERILLDLHSLSFLTDKKVVVLQQVDKLKKESLEKLERFIENPPRSHYLILVASQLNKTSRFYRKIETSGVVLEITELKSWEKEKKTVEWLGKEASVAHKLMSYPVCQQFVKQVGNDRLLLRQELEKIFCYIGERQEITLQDIQSLCVSSQQDTIWQLGEAIFRLDRTSALRISRGMIQEGQAFLPFLRQIRTQFQTEFQICILLSQGKHAADIAHDFPYMKGQILDRHIQFAQHYGLERFRQGLLTIDHMEIQSKNTQIEEGLLTELLICRLTLS